MAMSGGPLSSGSPISRCLYCIKSAPIVPARCRFQPSGWRRLCAEPDRKAQLFHRRVAKHMVSPLCTKLAQRLFWHPYCWDTVGIHYDHGRFRRNGLGVQMKLARSIQIDAIDAAVLSAVPPIEAWQHPSRVPLSFAQHGLWHDVADEVPREPHCSDVSRQRRGDV